MNVLIADDDAVTRRLLQHHLEEWGYDVTTAEDGMRAWQVYEKKHFDLVILDWIMPEMTGPEVMRKIRESDGLSDHCYVIFLTAKSDKSDMIASMDAGADDYLSKPFDKDELRARLQAGNRIITLQRKLNLQNIELAAMNQKIQSQLSAAATVQQALLPRKDIFDFGDFKLSWLFQPCDELAGDTLGIIPLNDDFLACYILDVSGHGISASLLSFAASYMLTNIDGFDLMVNRAKQSGETTVCSPTEVAEKLNRRFLFDEESQQYFTMKYALLNKRDHRMRYVSAGHPPLLHLANDGEATFSSAKGFPVGLTEESPKEHELVFEAHDRVFIYSDGLTESLGEDRRAWGRQRLSETAIATRALPMDKALAHIAQSANEWRYQSMPADDISLIGIERCQ